MPTRKSYAGAAVPTTISSGAFGIGATALTLTVATGWPTTAGGPFVATVDRGTATEEHILVAARAGTSCTSITRGYSGSAEVAHGSNAPIEHRWDATSADEANRIASLETTKGDLIVHDGTQPQRLAVGATAGHAALVTPAAATGLAYGQPLGNLVTTKGDLIAATGAAVLARLGVGANGQYLSPDSAQASGLAYSWAGIPIFASTAARDAAITAPVAGLVCYINSDDVNEGLYTYIGTVWRKGPGWNAPWGMQAYAVDSTPRNSSVSSAAALVVFPTLSFTPLTGRLYKVTWSASRVNIQALSGSSLVVTCTDTAGNVQDNLAVNLGGGETSDREMNGMFVGVFATGSITGLQVRAVSSYTVATVFQNATYGAYFSIEDVGPAGVPA